MSMPQRGGPESGHRGPGLDKGRGHPFGARRLRRGTGICGRRPRRSLFGKGMGQKGGAILKGRGLPEKGGIDPGRGGADLVAKTFGGEGPQLREVAHSYTGEIRLRSRQAAVWNAL